MLFSSIPFLYYFFPVFLIVYLIVPGRMKNMALLLGSLFFYAWGEPKYAILMITEIIVIYFLGVLIEKNHGKKSAKVIMCFAVILSLAVLGYYKYMDFFLETFRLPLLKIALPIGISFYTFQMLSYVVDVYRGDVKAQRNIVNLAMYISMFPQLIAGPIVRYSDIEADLFKRKHTLDKTAYGIRRFVAGLAKKVIIANMLGEIVKQTGNSLVPSVVMTWIYAISVSLQIYFDFSGYSDMAIGLGSILGFTFPENFNYPFQAKSATEFWRRWHMTLGSWFRDYLYIPLGGNRKGLIKNLINILIVWAATGLWHGASWNFVVWGLYFALFLILEKLLKDKITIKFKFVKHIYLCFIVMISFIIFNSANISTAFTSIRMLFGGNGIPFINGETLYIIRNYFMLLIISIIGATVLPKYIYNKLKWTKMLETIGIILLLIIVTAFLVNGSYNPFLYFRF